MRNFHGVRITNVFGSARVDVLFDKKLNKWTFAFLP